MENSGNKSLQAVCFGESFWFSSDNGSYPIGLPVLLSFYLHRLGIDPMLVTRVGLDEQGKKIIRFVEEKGLCTDYFQIDYDYPTGEWTNNGTKASIQASLQAWNNIIAEPAYISKFQNADIWVHSSIPAYYPGTACLKTLLSIIELNIRRVFYLTLHTSIISRTVLEQCLKGAFMLHTGKEELELITGWFSNIQSLADRVSILQQKFMIPYIVISTGKGSYFINAGGKGHQYESRGDERFSGPFTDHVFQAGLISAILNGHDIGKAIATGAQLKELLSSSGEFYPASPASLLNQYRGG
ncbi:MAG: carbohydrate kinase family protein [Chitinophagaceae bacterium]|nr:carbohydrate kinase family protein [Chitinophagaceae bacterium]